MEYSFTKTRFITGDVLKLEGHIYHNFWLTYFCKAQALISEDSYKTLRPALVVW